MLRLEIDNAKRAVTTDTVSITIGEVANMYNSQELNILPEFQRLFRWSDQRKSNFVESILIGIPIPPAFAYENENGTWELIDGLQRISTLLEFMGLLRDPDSGDLRSSRLCATKYLPSLQGVSWKSEDDPNFQIETSLQLFYRRSRIDFQILKHPSDPKTKFDLFQRLNRGGAYANAQEVRTCSMVLANPFLTRRMRSFVLSQRFMAIFRISPEQQQVQRDLDYLVRLIVHSSIDLPRGTDVEEFLDQSIISIISEDNASDSIQSAEWAVDMLYDALGPDALVPPDERAEGIAGRFSLRALEGIAVGIARNRLAINALPDPSSYVRNRVSAFWQEREVAELSASGLRGTVRIQRSVPFGERWFNPND